MNYPSSLLDGIRGRKIIPFVGAGVSRAVLRKNSQNPLFPSWSELLARASEKLREEGKPECADLVQNLLKIDKPDFLRAAEYAKENLGANWFRFIKEQFDHPRNEASDESLELARAIWRLGSTLVLTTNYDRVLTWSCSQADDLAIWNIEAPAEQAAMMRSSMTRPAVWHLHGTIDDAARIILTPDGYNLLYPSPGAQQEYVAALTSLNFLLSSHSIMFIGFGFNDATFGMTLKGVREIFAGANGPHYALIRDGDVDAAREAKLLGVELVTFSEFGQPLVDALKGLAEEVDLEGSLLADTESCATAAAIPHADAIEYDDTCDTPPRTATWVGREEELSLLKSPNLKVIAITGIGGQGKSTLGARLIETSGAQYDICDWRDCKEEDNTLHTHLVRIIERLTRGGSRAPELAHESIDSVVRLFLRLSLNVRGLFVFDNIDHYVDLHSAQAVKGMHSLIQGALQSPGSSRFIFTSRPRLQYDSAAFLQLELRGLDINEARSLFEARGLAISDADLHEMHVLLQGHPLWIGLIANQVLANRIKIREMIVKIRAGKGVGLPTTMLREIWKGLKVHQQKLLRYLAELVRPETEKKIAEYAAPSLSHNQFRTTLSNLKSLDLVVVKSPQSGPDTIELHPLVREFVRGQFSTVERNRYISAIILCLDRVIVQLRPSLTRKATFETLQNWIAKVELLTNSGDSQQALEVLYEASAAMIASGLSEDYVRLACGVLGIIDWTNSTAIDSPYFESACASLIELLCQLGRFGDAEEELRRFEHTTAGATSRYICICRLRAYLYWTKREYDVAKEWGRRGVALKNSSNIDSRYDCSHDLALAQRDSGETDEALPHFLHGADLEVVVDPKKIDSARHGHFYGNIGRTLYYMKRNEEAKSCLLKSAWILEQEDQPLRINQGWAACWLGELLEQQADYTAAYVCYRRAALRWRNISPFRADDAFTNASKLEGNIDPQVRDAEDAQIEHKYLVWLEQSKQF